MTIESRGNDNAADFKIHAIPTECSLSSALVDLPLKFFSPCHKWSKTMLQKQRINVEHWNPAKV